jgi:hypothetical protein
LSGDLEEVARHRSEGKTIVIQGGSHSAFSVANLILERFGSHLAPSQVRIYHQGVSLYFRSVQEASEHGYPLAGACVYRATGEVNKFHGLRGKAKALYQRALSGEEPRVGVAEKGAFDTFLSTARLPVLVIQAIGYQTRTIALRDAKDASIPVPRFRNCPRVDAQCRLLDAGGLPIPNLFGIGLGYARLSEDQELKIGVNFFHGPDGETIVRQVVDFSTRPVAALTSCEITQA